MIPGFQPVTTVHRIRAISLDLDNTLWAIEPVIHNAEASLWRWLGLNYPRIPETFEATDLLEIREAVIEEYWEHNHDFRFLRKQVLARVAAQAGYTEELVEPAFAVFDKARNDVELFPDVLPELEALVERFKIVAVTNGNANLEMIGIRHLFHDVVTAVDAGAPKPERVIFDHAVRKAGVDPHEVLHVGDHPETDIDGARQAGLRTAWINRSGEAWPEHLDAPDATVTTITELREMLERAGAG